MTDHRHLSSVSGRQIGWRIAHAAIARELVAARFAQSSAVAEAFFAAEAERIAEACWAMARRFHAGGRLLAFGNGACATDAQHVAVEFVHPVIVGKRALPALALTNDSAALSGACGGDGVDFARQIALLARPHDMAIGFSPDGACANVCTALLASAQPGIAGARAGRRHRPTVRRRRSRFLLCGAFA